MAQPRAYQVESVTSYIEKQEEHHRRISFEEEFRAILKRYRVAFVDIVKVSKTASQSEYKRERQEPLAEDLPVV